MSYKIEHESWLKNHLKKRKDRRLDALKRGHGYGNQLFAEAIWWKLFGHFKNLHPEYEILDWRGFPFYADFAWIIGSIRIIFEIQDFGSHVLNMDRSGHRRELNRGLFMQSMQYKVIYISLDELKENPELVLNMIRIILAPYLGSSENPSSPYCKLEKELMRLAAQYNRILRPVDAVKDLKINVKTVIRHLNQLVQKGKFRALPSGTSGRIVRYEYIGSLTDPALY